MHDIPWNVFKVCRLTLGSLSVAVTVSTGVLVGVVSFILVVKVPANIGPLLFLVMNMVTGAVVADDLAGIPLSLKRTWS